MSQLTNEQKAKLYDEYVRESDILQSENSKMKSESAGQISPENQIKINENERRINGLVLKLEDLFR